MDYSRDANRRKRNLRKSPVPKVKNKIGALILRAAAALAIIGVFAAGGVVVGAYLGIVEKAPKLTEVLIPSKEKYPSVIVDEFGVELQKLDGGENREFASVDEIPTMLKLAFVAIEDERFYQHDGVDFKGTVRAVISTLTSDSTQGGSTITQQIIKMRLKITRNSFITKFQEQHLATEYEKNMTAACNGSKEEAKERILEIYLNSVALGHGQVGVRAACGRYFDKDLGELTIAECAVLAAITSNPTFRDPIRRPASNRFRAEIVLKKMLELGFITKAEYDEAFAEDVYSKISENQRQIEETPSVYSYFTDQIIKSVKDALINRLAYSSAEADELIYTGGLKIYSTIDTSIQAIVDEAFMNESLFPAEYALEVNYTISVKNTTTGKVTHYPTDKKLITVGTGKDLYGKPYDAPTREAADEIADAWIESIKDRRLGADDDIDGEQTFKIPQPQAGMAIIDWHTGEVKALAGGRGEKTTNRAFNRATDAARQPGSVFKVLASYAPALDLGKITAGAVYDDVPFEVGDYKPNNWYSNPKYRGLATVREGIMNSMNILAVKNMYATGVDNALNYLRNNFGFTTITDDDRYLPTALGGITLGVKQVEIAAAFAAIANLGEYNEPIFFTKVVDHDGRIILENAYNPRRALKQTTAFILTDMMRDVITAGTGGQANFQTINMPIAGKTGTTSEDKDLVFAGYTPYYAASVYLGYDNPRQTASDSKSYHMRLWRYVMEKIHADLPYKDFEQPNGIVRADVCKDSGKIPIPGVCDSDTRGSRVKRNEVFAVGTEPNEYCDVHRVFERMDTNTGYIAGEFCPASDVRRVVKIVKKDRYDGGEFIGDSPYEITPAPLSGVICPYHNHAEPTPDDPTPDDPADDPAADPTPNPTPDPYSPSDTPDEPSQPSQSEPNDPIYVDRPTPTPEPYQPPVVDDPPHIQSSNDPTPTPPAPTQSSDTRIIPAPDDD